MNFNFSVFSGAVYGSRASDHPRKDSTRLGVFQLDLLTKTAILKRFNPRGNLKTLTLTDQNLNHLSSFDQSHRSQIMLTHDTAWRQIPHGFQIRNIGLRIQGAQRACGLRIEPAPLDHGLSATLLQRGIVEVGVGVGVGVGDGRNQAAQRLRNMGEVSISFLDMRVLLMTLGFWRMAYRVELWS